MDILDLDLDTEFQSCFTRSGSPVIECNCGREHVCINSYYFGNDESDEELANDYRKRAETDETLILNETDDDICHIEVNGLHFAEDCECKGWVPYMNFILEYRVDIKNFLIAVADKAQTALDQEKTFNILKDKKFEVLDDAPF